MTTANAISDALNARMHNGGPGPRIGGLPAMQGMAAGDAATKWSVWGNATQNNTHYDANLADVSKMDVLNGVTGFDYALTPTTATGLSLAIDGGQGHTALNSIDSHGYTLAPYVGIQLTPELTLDGSAGLGWGQYKLGEDKAESNRWFAATNLSYNQWMDQIQFSGKLSYIHAEEGRKNFRINDSTMIYGTYENNTLDQLRLTGRAGYWMHNFMPYVPLGLSSDLRRDSYADTVLTNPTGLNAWIWGLGVDIFSLGNNITGGIAYNHEEGRNNQTNYTLMGNINFRF